MWWNSSTRLFGQTHRMALPTHHISDLIQLSNGTRLANCLMGNVSVICAEYKFQIA